jgi:hypothetical protein
LVRRRILDVNNGSPGLQKMRFKALPGAAAGNGNLSSLSEEDSDPMILTWGQLISRFKTKIKKYILLQFETGRINMAYDHYGGQ